MQDNKTIAELLDSLNKSIEDIRAHPTTVDKDNMPTNLSIMVRGVSDSKALDLLFSTGVDRVIETLFHRIQMGDFDFIIQNESMIKGIVTSIFGEGSFEGPVSNEILNNLQITMSSYKYQTMKSWMGKTMTTVKKTRYLIRQLEKGSKKFNDDPEKKEKYKEAVYAIKQVLKFAAIIYKNRQIINKKVFNGLNNIVHEDELYDEPLVGWEDF